MSKGKTIDQQAQELWYETTTKRVTYPAGSMSSWHLFDQTRKQPWINKILAKKTK